jgi:hypothetical protein
MNINFSSLSLSPSNDSDDVVFERMTPSSPKRFEEPSHRDPFSHHLHRMSRGSADHSYHIDGTPDSPISQVDFYCSNPPSPSFTLSLNVNLFYREKKTFQLFPLLFHHLALFLNHLFADTSPNENQKFMKLI